MAARAETRQARWSELLPASRVAELERAGLRGACLPLGPERAGEPVLYLRGTLPTEPAVALVGTRQPTAEAVELTGRLAAELCAAGMCIVSGGALGIDEAAHCEALRQGARTVVVMGCGLDVVYPAEHESLYGEVVARGGCLVSMFPDGAQPIRFRFLQRNRLLAALSVALVVVQAPLRSGARSAAASARRLGRVVCAVPHAPWDERGAGCAEELVAGACPVRNGADVLRAVGGPLGARLGAPGARMHTFRARSASPPAQSTKLPAALSARLATSRGEPSLATSGSDAPPPHVEPPATPDELNIISVLGRSPCHVDELCERSGLPFGRLVATLMTLTLRSVVVEGPTAYYRLA